MARKWTLMGLLVLAVMALAGCAGSRAGATPQVAPAVSAAAPQPAASQPTQALTPVATPRPRSPAPTATPTAEVSARSGRVAYTTTVRAQPGGEALGELPAGALAIVTAIHDGYYKVVFAAAPNGYGWVAQDAVRFAPEEPAGQPASAPVLSPQPQVAATAPPASPTTQATPAQPRLAGKLVFQTGNGGDIYIMSADGSGLRRLTYGFEPALSPDGQQVAFTRWDEPRGLWVINADGSGERHLLTVNRGRSPTWAPDGQSIVLEHSTGSAACRQSPFGCLSDDELLALFGGQPCLTTPFGVFCIDDFPVVNVMTTGLVRYELASGAVRDLAASNSAAAPRYMPGGDAVIYLDRSGLAQARSEGNDPPRSLVSMPPLLGPAAPSPDGQFVYAARFAGNRWDLWRWRADGSRPTALTAPDPLASRPANHVAPAVSPDGRHIAFLTDRAGRWELWVMDSEGTNARPLAQAALADIAFSYDFNADRTVDWGR